MGRMAAVFTVTGLLWGVVVTASWAEQTEAIAIVSQRHEMKTMESAELWKAVITLLAVFHEGKWISGEELKKASLEGHAPSNLPPLRKDIYDALKGRTFVPADRSAGSFEAGECFYTMSNGFAYVMGCRGTREVGRDEETVVVTRRLHLPKSDAPPIPKKSAFLSVGRCAIEAQEQKDLQNLYRHDKFNPSPKWPLQVEELKPVVLPCGLVLYWVSIAKVYEDTQSDCTSDICHYTYSYHGIFSRSILGRWKITWESINSGFGYYNIDDHGFFGAPVAVCDVNGDSSPEIVIPEDASESWGWRTFELRRGKLEQVGAIMLE